MNNLVYLVKLVYTIGSQYTRQAETKAELTLSHIHITTSKHYHENLLTTKSKEASLDLTIGHASRPYKRLSIHF